MKKYVLLLVLILVGCDGGYRVRQDLEIKRSPSRTCVEEQIYRHLPESYSRFCEKGPTKSWKFTWQDKYGRHQGAFTQISKTSGRILFSLESSGVVAPNRDIQPFISSSLKNLTAEIEKNCRLEGIELNSSAKNTLMNEMPFHPEDC